MPEPLWIVTGAAGFLGSVIVKKLAAAGHRVLAGVFGERPENVFHGVNCELAWLDVTDPVSVQQLVYTHDPKTPIILIHCAGVVSIAGKVSKEVRQVNVGGTANIIDAARAVGARLVHVSSVHALDESGEGPITEPEAFDPEVVVGEYAKTKAEATQLVVDATDVDRVIVHPSGIIGPGDPGDSHLSRLIEDLVTGDLSLVVPGGHDLVDVRDVAEATITAALHGQRGEPYILSGHYVTVTDIAHMVSEVTGRKQARVLPTWVAKLAAPAAEVWAKWRGTAPLFTSYSLHALDTHSLFDHSKATEQLDYNPRPIAETIADTACWFKDRKC